MSSNGDLISGGLTAAPLSQEFAFNWVFLVELIVCGIVTLFFFFYFNRLFSTLASYGLRAWTWHRYRVYIDIQAFQISLLGGRVFFKGLRYHGNNETILIHRGFITWCYWLRNVRELDLEQERDGISKPNTESDNEAENEKARSASGAEEGGIRTSAKLPCRLNVSLHGAEWFVYNRSAAYDAVVASMTRETSEIVEEIPENVNEQDEIGNKVRKRARHSSHGISSSKGTSLDLERTLSSPPLTEKGNSNSPDGHKLRESSSEAQSEGSEAGDKTPNGSPQGAFILRFLPIHIDCVKAAVVLGNENTKSVLITKAERVNGEIDASRPGTALDQYRQLFNFHFEHPVVQIKPNDDYKEDQSASATRIKRGVGDQPNIEEKHSHSFWHRQRRKVWHRLQDLVPRFRSSVESFSSSLNGSTQAEKTAAVGSGNWQGLSRYLDESEQDDRARWSSIEYATVTTIVDSPDADMSFYWDVVGHVPARSQTKVRREKETTNINGDYPPQWGLNLSLQGAIINYGPWADRQRADLQRVFFPSLCKDAIPSKPLVPGQFRIPTEFKVYIQLDDETTLRVPIREDSKNWKWTTHIDAMRPAREAKKASDKSRKAKVDKGIPSTDVRPFGWLDIKVGANATVSYVMDMLARESGYENKLNLEFPSIEVTTSVNHGLLLRSTASRVSCDLSNPLQWNGHRTWKFDLSSNGLELFLLREHVFLLIDLVDDWASGPPPEYLIFAPYRYLVNLHLDDFRIYLNVNDSNIINNPSDFDDNTLINIFGEVLDADICIPLENYRPHRNDVTFDVDARRGGLKLHVPPWNTQATFLSSPEIATLQELMIDGTYQYCSTTSPSNTDTLLLNVHGNTLTAQIYGFIVRYYIKVKDNYFGDDIHFRTLEEYQDVLKSHREGLGNANEVAPLKKSNDLDVVLSVSANDASAILPANLYTAKNHTRIEIATLSADLRFTNYYMDLDATFNTMAFAQGCEADGATTPMSAVSNTQLFIDGININGNRLFGLPPAEPTYMCNWDFSVGAITGECSSEFFNRLASGGRCVGFSFDDDENALPLILQDALHDVTYLRAYVESVRVWMHVEEAAFLFSTGDISVNFNDLAGSHYSKKLNLQIPDLQFACVDAESASRHRSRSQHPVETHALFQTAVSFVMIQRKLNFEADRKLQQEHIKRHDQRTHRTDFLLNQSLLDDSVLSTVDPPAMTVPLMPVPILPNSDEGNEDQSMLSVKSSLAGNWKRGMRRQSSFLSIASSGRRSTHSVLRPQSPGRDTQYTDIRSRSLQIGLGLGYRGSHRDASASTGRQSSFYSAIGDSRGLPPSSVTFSSSFIAPYFPLEAVEPDTKDLPFIPVEENFKVKKDSQGLEDIQPDRVPPDTEHVTFMLELPSGVRGVFNPQAVDAVAGLITAIQAVDPVDILDELQMDAMNEIFELNRQKSMNSKIADFSVCIPGISIRFLNSSGSEGSQIHENMSDQYDLNVNGLSIATRSETLATDERLDNIKVPSSVFQVTLGSARISAKERCNGQDDPQAAFDVILDEIIFWLVSGQKTSAKILLRRCEATTRSNKIEYLASLLHRTEAVGSSMAETFTSRATLQKNRVQLFTFLVATNGQQTADPLFLTRPSYVLRSADNHLRTTDSWKVVTRLHHIYTNLDSATQQDIIIRCLDNTELVPEDARQRVMSSFTQWRSWDLNNIQACLVMARVFGSIACEPDVQESKPSPPIRIAFNTRSIRLILDPGPKQNEVALFTIGAVLESQVVKGTAKSGSQKAPELASVRETALQLFCANVSINLNWELCELADDILKLYQGNPEPASAKSASTVGKKRPAKGPRQSLHVAIVTEKGSITLDTINIRAASISQNLKASIVMVEGMNEDISKATSIVLSAKAATSKVRSHSQELSIYQLRHPSVYFSHEVTLLEDVHTNSFKAAGYCQELSFVVRQDILALIEVLDLVIGDEVAQLHKLLEMIPASKPHNLIVTVPSPEPKSVNKLNVALFLDMYQIAIPLLHSLTYNVSGVIARVSVAAQLGTEIVFDFDIKDHSHNIETHGGKKDPQSISLLHMPPTNGRVTTHMSTEETVVSVFVSVEPVMLDAAAVHSLLAALNRPEISSVVTDVKEDIKAVQAHIEEIFGPPKVTTSKSSTTPSKPLIYDGHLTLAGFDVFANAQGVQNGHPTARLDFNLGSVQLIVANRLEQSGPILEYPELRVSMRQIVFEISRREHDTMEQCGNLTFGAFLTATSKINDSGTEVRSFHLKSDGLEINLFADTASSIVDIIGHLQDKIKDLDFSREKKYLRKLRKSKPRLVVSDSDQQNDDAVSNSTVIFGSMYSLELLNIQVSWIVGSHEIEQPPSLESENLVLSLKRIDLSTRKENSARLTIEDLQLQMVPMSQNKIQRSLNSALLPEVIFNVGYVSTIDARRLAFQAAGKSLDLRLTSQFIIPAAELQKSIGSAVDKVRAATETWTTPTPGPPTEASRRKPFFGKKRMESLLVDADFAGAVVYLSGKRISDTPSSASGLKPTRVPQSGRYGQFTHTDSSSNTVLRAPGLAWKVEYKDNGLDDPSLNAEVKVDASSNILYPAVVPLIMEITSAVKDMVSDDDVDKLPKEIKTSPQKFLNVDDDNILSADPSTVLGRTRLNLGLRICRQEFSLSCQPIARVAATARFEEIYTTINTVRSTEHGHFFTASTAFKKLQASVQHVYSRESTGSFDVDSVFLSLMNSKHVSGTSGLSAILKISPMKVLVNAKQLQDFLLFREIWVPVEIRKSAPTPTPPTSPLQHQTILVQRYQQVAATGAFPWNATVSIAELDVQLDLGQAIGKSAFMISNFWVSSKKNSDWEQNLCLGFDKVGVDSTGRMSGYVALQNFKLRTSIQWPAREKALNQTPLVQGSLAFSQLRVKAAFDYQAFLVADITSFEFLMYNVRHQGEETGDRLVAILDGEAVQVFCTTMTASQALALYQAFQRLVQEKRANYEASLTEIERFMKRKSVSHPNPSPMPKTPTNPLDNDKMAKSPISLHTDVIVTLKAVNVGAFPNTFSDHQIFKLEALNAQARFAVRMDAGKIHSILGLTLGQLRIGLAGVKKIEAPKSVGEISVEDVVNSATGSRGGTILKVPKVEAIMQTWQVPNSNHIDYIFKSSFEGKVEVGWNYSRISYIRSMWGAHSKALAQRLGKPLPISAVKITGVPDEEEGRKGVGQQKITAEVNVPVSKYDYTALEPPIIETPQLRDMGEATPPLEWIGLHRDRLPNLTHQIVIVTLLELASEVEEAYGKILGAS